MTKEELEKATGQELIDERNYCGVDGYYGDYLDNVNAEMLKRFNRLAELEAQIEIDAKQIRALQKQNGELTDKVKELQAQIEKMSEILLGLLWFEEHLDPYMYDCNDAQKGELLKPFDNARLFLEKYKCKKCKGEGIIKVGYNGWTTNPCPACEGKGYILRR